MTAQEAITRPNGLDGIIPRLEKVESGKPREPQENEAEVLLPPELDSALREIKDQFTVDSEVLKDIVEHFQQELTEGLEKEDQNIVRLPPCFAAIHFALVYTDSDGVGHVPSLGFWIS